MANGRLVSNCNWQNIPARGPSAGLRYALCAPEGCKVVVGDSANIELRVAMVAAGQNDIVEMIRNGEDLYCHFASRLFGRTITKADKKERQIGKVAMLGLQYGMGWVKFKETVRVQTGEVLTDEIARATVDLYRNVHGWITRLWDYCGSEILNEIYNNGGTNMLPVDRNAWCITGNDGFGVNGSPGVVYHNLRKNIDGEWMYTMGNETECKIYGGKVVENLCISGDSLVLTENGWIPIADVGSERVHDGVELVQHGGKVYKGVKQVVAVDGVLMTPDHEVLTNEGWKAALEEPEPYRPSVRGADRLADFAQRWQEDALGVPVFVRDTGGEGRLGSYQGGEARGDAQLRLYDQGANQSWQHASRDVQAPRLHRVAQHVGSLPTAFASSVGELWREGHRGLFALARGLRELLGGYGADVYAGAYAGSHGQRGKLHPGELSVGDVQSSDAKQAQQHRAGLEDAIRTDRDTPLDVVLPLPTREVFDLMDCGPRNRFVVLGENGPFIVHNCQHIARQIVMWQTARINERYPVALSVHDEAVIVVADDEVDDAKQYMIECLSLAPPWCGGAIPLSCEVGFGQNYGAAKP